jgi:hypothetical protein
MIQLPVVVPRPSPDQAARYLTELLPPVARTGNGSTASATPLGQPAAAPGTPSAPEPSREPVAPQPIGAPHTERDERLEELAKRELGKSGGVEGGSSAPRRELLARNLASEPAFHAACRWSAENLVPELNPRRLKRLLAMIELQALIANRLGYLNVDESGKLEEQLCHVGVFAALNVRWPHVVDRLLAPRGDDPHGPLMIELLRATESGDRDGGSGTPPGCEVPTDLRDFLATHTEALEMVVRLTTLEPVA